MRTLDRLSCKQQLGQAGLLRSHPTATLHGSQFRVSALENGNLKGHGILATENGNLGLNMGTGDVSVLEVANQMGPCSNSSFLNDSLRDSFSALLINALLG